MEVRDFMRGGSKVRRLFRGSILRGLTFELTGALRGDALARLAKMYSVPLTGPRWPAVARPVERGVRRRRCAEGEKDQVGLHWLSSAGLLTLSPFSARQQGDKT